MRSQTPLTALSISCRCSLWTKRDLIGRLITILQLRLEVLMDFASAADVPVRLMWEGDVRDPSLFVLFCGYLHAAKPVMAIPIAGPLVAHELAGSPQ